MLLRGTRALALLAGASLCASASAVAPDSSSAPPSQGQLAAAIAQMEAGQGRDALRSLESLTREQPDFRLGRQLYGELLAALSDDAGAVPVGAGDPGLQALAAEAQMRLASEKAVPPKGSLPDGIVHLAPLFRHAILVDVQRARLYVLENLEGALSLTRHHYIGIGKNGYGKQVEGDQRTPIGVYRITGWKGDAELPELYGTGAFPMDYPNRWDQFMRRSGTGIWLHGVPRNVYTRPPRSSEGCVTMANDDLLALRRSVSLGMTPVVLTDRLEWQTAEQAQTRRNEWLTRIETWRQRWSTRATDAYLSDYAPDFTTTGMNYAEFAAHKRRVNETKKFIQVELRDINIFRYPGMERPTMMAEFSQDYRSDNYSSVARKQQFWRQEADGSWKIFREDNR